MFAGFVQLFQFTYQSGTLYKMMTLGHLQSMDVTVGLLPFLCWIFFPFCSSPLFHFAASFISEFWFLIYTYKIKWI